MIGASVVTFGLIHLAPMDPARFFVQFRPGTRDEQVRQLRDWYGLEEPVPAQYVRWVSRAIRGDFGRSITSGRDISPEVVRRIPWTLLLVSLAFLLACLMAVPLALAAARGGVAGAVAGTITMTAGLIPGFLLASLLVYIFAVRLTWIPILPPFELNLLDAYLWRSMLLPAISLAVPIAALVARELARALHGHFEANHVTAARARGLTERRIVWRHALGAAIRPFLARPLPLLSVLFGGAVIVEDLFGWPGIARVFMRAIVQRDITVIQASLLLLAALVIVTELLLRLAVDRRDVLIPVSTPAPRPAGPTQPARPVPGLDLGARIALGVGAALIVAAVAAPLLARFPPDQVLLEEIQMGPSVRHWMGTDASGRDLFSRLLFAGRVTLALTVIPALAAVAAAVALGGLAIWRTSAWADVTAGTSRTLLATPGFALALSVISVAGRAPLVIGIMFALFGLAEIGSRAQTLVAGVKSWSFIDAGLAAGASPAWIGERHLLPHLIRPLLSLAFGLVPGLLILEATMGFFGFSVTPTIPTWGTLLWRGREALHRGDWWLLAFPAAFVVAASWGFLRVADALADPPPPTYVKVPKLVLGREWGTRVAGTARATGAPGYAQVPRTRQAGAVGMTRRLRARPAPPHISPATATGGPPDGGADGES